MTKQTLSAAALTRWATGLLLALCFTTFLFGFALGTGATEKRVVYVPQYQACPDTHK